VWPQAVGATALPAPACLPTPVSLRLILLLLGAGLVLAIYVWESYRRGGLAIPTWRGRGTPARPPSSKTRPTPRTPPAGGVEQALADLGSLVRSKRRPAASGTSAAGSAATAAARAELPTLHDAAEATPPPPLTTLYVATDAGAGFSDADVRRCLEREGLALGPMDIYHDYAPGEQDGEPRFSVADMYEPGTLDAAVRGPFHTLGLVFFLRHDGVELLERMLACAEAVAAGLDGELLDGNRQPLDQEGIAALRHSLEEDQGAGDAATVS